jgi:hypothetical protein
MLGYGLASDLQDSTDLLPGDGREVLEEIVDTIAGLQVVEERCNGHACAREANGTRQNVWVGSERVGKVSHDLVRVDVLYLARGVRARVS